MSEMFLERNASIGHSKTPVWAVLHACTRRVINKWHERRAIRELQEMDDHMLRDMGVSRSDIRAAVRGELYRP